METAWGHTWGSCTSLKRRSTHGDSVPIELFHMYDDSRCMYVVIVQDCRKQDRNGQQRKKKTRQTKEQKRSSLKFVQKKTRVEGTKETRSFFPRTKMASASINQQRVFFFLSLSLFLIMILFLRLVVKDLKTFLYKYQKDLFS
jgi:hypothetical protein